MTDTSSEAWRHQCEVLHVVAMPTRAQRAQYLDGLEKWRGQAAAQRLRDDVRAAWLARGSSTAPHLPEANGAPAPDAVHLAVHHTLGQTLPETGSFLGLPHGGDSDPTKWVQSEVPA